MDDAAQFVTHLRTTRGLDVDQLMIHPSVYPHMGRAVQRVRRALGEAEIIGIFGDYDCDGVTSTALLQRLLKRHGTDPVVRLPHRARDGYGLRVQHVDAMQEQGVTLLMTVDNGISAHQAIAHARERGIDVIVLDHHHCEAPPSAYAIVHPALAPDHPEPHPSAAGVVLQFIRAFEEGETWHEHAIDRVLAMMGIVADLVPLTGGNRLLVQQGLDAITRLPDGPLKAFIDRTCDGTVTSTDVGWRLAPRINAAGRMDNPMIALRALTDGGEDTLLLDTLNVQRQSDTADALDHALAALGPEEDLPAFLCVASAQYSPGIVGLIAGKLTERFGRPSLAACIDGETCTASFRSPPGYNVAEALRRSSDLLTHFGGHAQAAGASFPLDTYLTLSDRLAADAARHLGSGTRAPSLHIDGITDAEMIDLHLHRHLSSLAPFGQGNPEPVLMIEGVALERTRRVGSGSQHLQGKIGNIPIIGFHFGHLLDQIGAEPVDLACRIGVNTWNGKTEAQLMLVDIRCSEETRYKKQDTKKDSILNPHS